MGRPSPQVEDGFVRFAIEWLEAFISAPYPGSLKDFVLIIARETWGWNETWRAIPVKRFTELLSVTETRFYQLRVVALEHNLIEMQEADKGNQPTLYRVQKDYLDWIEYRPSATSKKSGQRLKHVFEPKGRGLGSRTPLTPRVKDVVDPESQGHPSPPSTIDSLIDTLKDKGEANPSDFNHMEACGDPFIAEFTTYLRAAIPIQKAQAWACDFARRVRLKGSGVTEEEAISALRDGNPPRGKEQTFAENYLDRLVKEKERASMPGGTPPELAKFIEAVGYDNRNDGIWLGMFKAWQEDPTAPEVLAYLAEGQRRQAQKAKRLEAKG